MGLLYGRAGCLTAENGGFRPGQSAGFEESVEITATKTMDGTGFYEVTWCDKRGRVHVVWKRYSRFRPRRPGRLSGLSVP